MRRDSFVFYRSFYGALKAIDNNEDKIKFVTAMCEYAIEGNEVELDGMMKAMFLLVKPQIDANNKKYEDGKKGGRPPKDTETY